MRPLANSEETNLEINTVDLSNIKHKSDLLQDWVTSTA